MATQYLFEQRLNSRCINPHPAPLTLFSLRNLGGRRKIRATMRFKIFNFSMLYLLKYFQGGDAETFAIILENKAKGM